jgi:hypothetical protein
MMSLNSLEQQQGVIEENAEAVKAAKAIIQHTTFFQVCKTMVGNAVPYLVTRVENVVFYL